MCLMIDDHVFTYMLTMCLRPFSLYKHRDVDMAFPHKKHMGFDLGVMFKNARNHVYAFGKHCQHACVFIRTTLSTSLCVYKENACKHMVTYTKHMINHRQNTLSGIVKKHCQSSSTNMVDNHLKMLSNNNQQTLSNIV
jgi:hypothetical protein